MGVVFGVLKEPGIRGAMISPDASVATKVPRSAPSIDRLAITPERMDESASVPKTDTRPLTMPRSRARRGESRLLGWIRS